MLRTLKVPLLRRYNRFNSWRTWRAPSVHQAPGALELAGAAGPIRAHLYRGRHAHERPLVVYFHGGGRVVGNLQTHHAYCTALCEASGASIIAVDYRRAPEHPFPAAQKAARTERGGRIRALRGCRARRRLLPRPLRRLRLLAHALRRVHRPALIPQPGGQRVAAAAGRRQLSGTTAPGQLRQARGACAGCRGRRRA